MDLTLTDRGSEEHPGEEGVEASEQEPHMNILGERSGVRPLLILALHLAQVISAGVNEAKH